MGVEDEVVVLVPGAERVGLELTVEVLLDDPVDVSERVPFPLTDGEDVVLGDFVLEIETVAEEVPVPVRVDDTDAVAVGVPIAV